MDRRKDRALGCILGALVGDAAGAPLEFKRGFGEADLESALRMSGGGSLNLAKGQITDDGELTLALASALQTSGARPHERFPLGDIARAYQSWFKSGPVDCGMTCGRAFAVLHGGSAEVAECMLANAARCNTLSQANGALMRATPIPVWCHRDSSSDAVAHYARLDALLSHPSQTCQDCNAAYCVALWSLIRSGGDAGEARHEFENFVAYRTANPEVQRWLVEETPKYFVREGAGGGEGGGGGRHESIATSHIGHVKHAFCLVAGLLRDPPPSYEAGIRHVLRLGGDTDTNAAIAGGLLGAIFGWEAIPGYMLWPVLAHSRDARFSPLSAAAFVDHCFPAAP